MKFFRRNEDSIVESHQENVSRAGDAVARTRIKVKGVVLRIRSKPADGLPTLIATIGDDDGRVQAHWTGRRTLPGLALGAKVIIEGVASPTASGLVFLNPRLDVVDTH